MLNDKMEEIVALRRLEMNKEEGFPITSLREINTVLKVQHEKIVTVKGYHSVEDFNCLNLVHDHIEWCIMLKDKMEEIVALKGLEMNKEEGFPITSLREINTVLKVQHEKIVTVKGCRSAENFNCFNPVHEHIEWCIMLNDKTEDIVALKELKMEKNGSLITSLRETNTVLREEHENIVTVKGYHSVEDINSLNPVHDHIEWCIMLNDKKAEEIVALKGLKMKKEDGFLITSLRETNTVLRGEHENIVTVKSYHSVKDFNYLSPVHDHIEWCIMLKDKKTEDIVALTGLKMEKEGFPITSLREINTELKGQHENVATLRGYHRVKDFNSLNPVHDHIEWCIILKDKKTEEIVALKRLKMEKEGFPITSLREINTALKGQHENVATLRVYHSVEDFNSLNPVHDHIEWCIMLKDKTKDIVALKGLKMKKKGGRFPHHLFMRNQHSVTRPT